MLDDTAQSYKRWMETVHQLNMIHSNSHMTDTERQANLQLTQQWYLCIELEKEETIGNRVAPMIITDNLSRVKKTLTQGIVYTYPQHIRVTDVTQTAVTL